MRDKEEQNRQQPAERQPLMNKLEPSRSRSNAWHHEGEEWSKTGRDIVKMIMDALRSLFG